MADTKEKERDVEEEDEESSDETESDSADGEGGEEAPERAEESEDAKASTSEEDEGSTALAKREETEEEEEEEEGEDDPAATQLGTNRYVLAGFFAAGMIGAYVLGRTIDLVWATVSNKDWFSRTLPRLAAVADDDKNTYSLILAGIIALFMVIRTYRKPEVRQWSDEVASELTKVKWPTRKEVTNSTIIVIAASAIATIYLALLDRLWAFVTNIVYGGDGS